MLSGVLLWLVYGGPREHLGAVPLVAVSFFATLWTIAYGQNTGLLLFGLAGFAFFTRHDRPALAGACAALTALKPHLLAPFGVLLVLNAVRPRGLVTLLSGVSTVALGLAVALLVDPNIIDQYLTATRDADAKGAAKPLSGWMLPQGAYYLRIAVAPTRFWVQFVPCAAACLAYAVYFLRKRRSWDWAAELPLLVGVSVLTAAYGGWMFDLAVLLVPVMQAAARLANGGRAFTIRLFAACHVALTAATFAFMGPLDSYFWAAPVTLALCAVALFVEPVARARP